MESIYSWIRILDSIPNTFREKFNYFFFSFEELANERKMKCFEVFLGIIRILEGAKLKLFCSEVDRKQINSQRSQREERLVQLHNIE